MIKLLIKLILIFIIILIIFALIPENFWNKIKPYFNWEIFINTIKSGWVKFINFIEDVFGFKFKEIPEVIQKLTGINCQLIFSKVRLLIGNFFEKIANWFK